MDEEGKIAGTFIESGSPEEFALMKKLAATNPKADPAKISVNGLAYLKTLA